MKVVKKVVALWLCLIFVSSGLQGLVLCVSSHGGIGFKMEEDSTCGKPCTQSHEDHHDQDDARSILQSEAEQCCYKCAHIPLSGTELPDCVARQVKITKVSKERVVTCVNVALPSYSSQSIASAFASSYLVQGIASRPDRTVVLRI